MTDSGKPASIERAITGATDALGHTTTEGEETIRTFTDHRISLQAFEKNQTPGRGYAALVIGPDHAHVMVYLRNPGEAAPEIHRPGMWTAYLAALEREALSLPGRRDEWLATTEGQEGGDQDPIDDRAVFGAHPHEPASESADDATTRQAIMEKPGRKNPA